MKHCHPDIIDGAPLGAQWLRPATAVKRFEVSRSTLERWVRAGLIRRSRPTGGACWLNAADIADLIANGASTRTVVPIATQTPATVDESWRTHRLWKAGR